MPMSDELKQTPDAGPIDAGSFRLIAFFWISAVVGTEVGLAMLDRTMIAIGLLAGVVAIAVTRAIWPRGKRFQFRLRTLFAVALLVAIPCTGAGWQASVVRHRKSVQRYWEERGAVFCFSALSPPSNWRRAFGDMSAFYIWIRACDQYDRDEIQGAFPEAEIKVGGEPPIID